MIFDQWLMILCSFEYLNAQLISFTAVYPCAYSYVCTITNLVSLQVFGSENSWPMINERNNELNYIKNMFFSPTTILILMISSSVKRGPTNEQLRG